MRPQHLKDMFLEKDSQDILLPALTTFVQKVLERRTPATVRPFFFGPNLTAPSKEQGGIRPIAVSCTLARLVVNVAGSRVMNEMEVLLAPQLTGFGVKGGAEAAMHAVKALLAGP